MTQCNQVEAYVDLHAVGIQVSYGKPERWKKNIVKYGHSKRSRAPGYSGRRKYHNDGRPPDTTLQLLRSIQSDQKTFRVRIAAPRVGGTRSQAQKQARTKKTPKVIAAKKRSARKTLQGLQHQVTTPTTTNPSYGGILQSTESFASPLTDVVPFLPSDSVPTPQIASSDAHWQRVLDPHLFIEPQVIVPVALQPSESNQHQAELRYSQGYPSYPWSDNSCWLDTSLELIYQAIMRNYSCFTQAFLNINTSMSIHRLVHLLDQRRALHRDQREFDLQHSRQVLTFLRDHFRTLLYELRIINSKTTPQPVFVSRTISNSL